jgi:hypothetical protein
LNDNPSIDIPCTCPDEGFNGHCPRFPNTGFLFKGRLKELCKLDDEVGRRYRELWASLGGNQTTQNAVEQNITVEASLATNTVTTQPPQRKVGGCGCGQKQPVVQTGKV